MTRIASSAASLKAERKKVAAHGAPHQARAEAAEATAQATRHPPALVRAAMKESSKQWSSANVFSASKKTQQLAQASIQRVKTTLPAACLKSALSSALMMKTVSSSAKPLSPMASRSLPSSSNAWSARDHRVKMRVWARSCTRHTANNTTPRDASRIHSAPGTMRRKPSRSCRVAGRQSLGAGAHSPEELAAARSLRQSPKSDWKRNGFASFALKKARCYLPHTCRNYLKEILGVV